jgi:hypothetical protein
MDRRINVQTVAWFYDQAIKFDTYYRDKNVWSITEKNYFIDSVIHNYPTLPIFVYEEITTEGLSELTIFDGRQRLYTLIEFIRNNFTYILPEGKRKYFKDFSNKDKQAIWQYKFTIEYLCAESVKEIFKRLNAKQNAM